MNLTSRLTDTSSYQPRTMNMASAKSIALPMPYSTAAFDYHERLQTESKSIGHRIYDKLNGFLTNSFTQGYWMALIR